MKPMAKRIYTQKKRTDYTFTSLKGAMGELEVANFFMKRGYFVFRNLAQYGPDLVIMKDQKTRVVEVKHHSAAGVHAPKNLCDWVVYLMDDQLLVWNVDTDEKKYYPRCP